ncbi:MAG: adenylate/guanylate cyclase domain-containing protein [Terriglobales bacterium]
MSEKPDSGIRVTKLLHLAEADPAALAELERFRRTLVVMFSDIQGSTAYFEKHGDSAGLFMVHQCNEAIRNHVEKHGGKVIKTIGDGAMVTFPEPKEAVEAAIEIQVALRELAAAHAESEPISLRIGMHYGTGIVRTNDVFGDVVNTASRVESVARPGQILLSEEIYWQVRECGFAINEAGRFVLKGKIGERALFQVRWRQGEGAVTDCGAAPVDSPLPAPSSFKLQLVYKDGTSGTEYPLQSEVGLGLSADSKLVISTELHLAGFCARVLLKAGIPFVEDMKDASQPTFLRLSSVYLLESGDIFLAGQQRFRYEEKLETSSLTATTTAQGDVGFAAASFGMLARIDAEANTIERYPLTAPQMQFGRKRGDYLFPDDHLMSRAHFVISRRAEDFLLEDAGSRNGTFVQVRKQTPLSAGSILLIGGQVARVIC